MHGGNLRLAGELYGKGDFIDLSANINVFGPPAGVFERLKQALPQIVHYPDPESKALRRLLSKTCSLPEERIMIGNGAGELIFTILQTLKPQRVLIPVPAFSEYEKAALAVGAQISHLTLGAAGWGPPPGKAQDLKEFAALWTDALQDKDLLFLCSPHNPTGSALTRAQMGIIMDIARQYKCRVLFDESFYDFLSDALRWTAREFLTDYPNLAVIYSLTKFYSLPGLRLGAAFARPEWIEEFTKHRDPWSVNALAQEAGAASLEDPGYPPAVRKQLGESREFFYQEFASRKFSRWKLYETVANFALLELREGKSADLVKALGKKRILVRDCANFSGLAGEFVRVAIKDQQSMKAFLEALEEIERKAF